jgi:hypothetical protein
MTLSHSRILIAVLATTLASCSDVQTSRKDQQSEIPTISGDAIFAHVSLLADDLYEGREAGTRGYQLAAKYVATQFEVMGLQPGNNGSYFQTISFSTANIVGGSRELTVAGANGKRSYAALEEFTSTATLAGDEVSITAPLVFVGYGVNAPSIERNDYENVDLEGKIAVVVIGAPVAFWRAVGPSASSSYSTVKSHRTEPPFEAPSRQSTGLLMRITIRSIPSTACR